MYNHLGELVELSMDAEIRCQPSQALAMLRKGTLASMCLSRAKSVQEAVFSARTDSDRQQAWEMVSDGLYSTEPDEEEPPEGIQEQIKRLIQNKTYGGTVHDLAAKEMEKQGIPWSYNPISKGRRPHFEEAEIQRMFKGEKLTEEELARLRGLTD